MSILWERMPSIELIENQELKLKVRACWNEAINRSVFTEDEVSRMAFTLLIPDCPANLLQHTESVTACAYELGVKIHEHNPLLNFDMDILVAGGLLHDVGKVLEYDKLDGNIIEGQFGKYLRHPFSGASLAMEMGLPAHVAHIIAAHSKEGDSSPRTMEANLIHHADYLNFELYKIKLDAK